MFRFSGFLILIVSCCLIFSSCENSEEPKDTAGPEITIAGLTENQRVKGTITIAVTLADASKELSAEILLDESVIKSGSTKDIDVEIDTKTLTEGTHSIKIIAIDGAKNASEKVLMFEVRNVLFKFHMPSNYIYGTHEQIYYGISRNDGTPIAFQQIFQNTDMIVPIPADFNPDSTFVLSKYAYANDPGVVLVKGVEVYAGLHAGEYFVAVPPASRTNVGNHQVTVTDIPSATYNFTISGKNVDRFEDYFGNNSIQTQLALFNTTSDLYFNFEVTGNSPDAYKPVYKYISNISTGGTTSLSISSLTPMPKVDVTTTDLEGSYNYSVSSNDAYPMSLYYRESNFVDGKIPVYYPSTALSDYDFYIRYQLGGTTYYNHLIRATPPASFDYLKAEVSTVNYANRKLKVKATGSYDNLAIASIIINYDGATSFYDAYNVHFPKGISQVVVPDTPSELANLGFAPPATINFTLAGLYDYLTLSSLSDYQNKIVFNSDNLYKREYIGKDFQITQTNQAGRVSGQSKVTLPKSIRDILRRHQPLTGLEFH